MLYKQLLASGKFKVCFLKFSGIIFQMCLFCICLHPRMWSPQIQRADYTLNLNIHLPLPECCIFSYVFMLPVSILYFNLENSFQYFLRYRSSNDIFLKFCQKKKCILPSFDKILFVGSFSLLFSTLNVQSCSLLACKTLLRNPLIGLLAFPDE